jgi:hypothetical protein
VNTFEIVVTCSAGGARHEHLVVVSSGDGQVVGAARPQNVRLQYVCPTSGRAQIMTFKPPAGLARPYVVETVT